MNQLSGEYYNLKTEKPFYYLILFWTGNLIMRTGKLLPGKKVH